MKKASLELTRIPSSDLDQRFLTEREVAERLGVSQKTVARHNLRPFYLGRRKLYRWTDVLAAFDERAV